MTRVRVTGGPWPERVGRAGVIVERPSGSEGGVYPWHGKRRDEVVVLLDDDPLAFRYSYFDADGAMQTLGWSMVMRRGSVEILS